MLARHDRAIVQAEFAQMRRATHYGYVWIITPAAILAIFIGSALILMRDVFTVWIFVKLILVTGLVAVHAWVGQTIVAVAETEGQLEPPEPLVSTIVILGLVKGILFLVLGSVDIHRSRMTVDARAMKALKLVSVLQHRVAMPLYSLSFPKKFSIRCRHL